MNGTDIWAIRLLDFLYDRVWGAGGTFASDTPVEIAPALPEDSDYPHWHQAAHRLATMGLIDLDHSEASDGLIGWARLT